MHRVESQLIIDYLRGRVFAHCLADRLIDYKIVHIILECYFPEVVQAVLEFNSHLFALSQMPIPTNSIHLFQYRIFVKSIHQASIQI